MPSKSKAETAASKPAEEAVRHRAYVLWEADGKPAGKSDHYWHLAMAEMTERTNGEPARAAKPGAPKSQPAKASKTATVKPAPTKAAKKAEPTTKKPSPRPRAAVPGKKNGKGAAASA